MTALLDGPDNNLYGRNNGPVVRDGDSSVFYNCLPWCSKLHHFDGTTSKTELHWPHRTLQTRKEKSSRLRSVGP